MSTVRHLSVPPAGVSLAHPSPPAKVGAGSAGTEHGLGRMAGVLALWIGLGLLLAVWLARS